MVVAEDVANEDARSVVGHMELSRTDGRPLCPRCRGERCHEVCPIWSQGHEVVQ